MDTIGFIGTGHLGYPIAENLIRAGYKLKVYNRTASKAEPLKALGAEIVSSPEAAATKGGIVMSLVSDDAAVEAVNTDALLSALGNGGVHVSMSTIGPEAARKLAEKSKAHGVTYIAAPVFARPEAAAAKVGNAVIAGEKGAKERITPLLQAGFAKNVFDLGEDPGSANVLKLIGNFMIAASIELMSEAFTLAEKNNLDTRVVYEMLTTTLFASPIFRNYGGMILDRQFAGNPSFSAALGLKDIDLVLQTGKATLTPLPMADLVKSRLLTVLAQGVKDADWLALATGAMHDAGLKP
ncbi:NAD(P)-dependent oxidoreductase [Chitinophaga silvatica]|uniref:NAD(P)-dependent oxidoreductase n=1 Tax=Chitinophaga silvatica TaxID=2282649 RepID=A0A3E1Y9B5_9BACT|nr:NAD(P)-dependent oxidoreductase [Chitinophaga silvatica]RFS21995.1 NAD(P)-dependent oxidoreductase [Chitinophaga silvatica]